MMRRRCGATRRSARKLRRRLAPYGTNLARCSKRHPHDTIAWWQTYTQRRAMMLKAKSLAHESAHHAITSTITNSDTLAQSSQSLNGVLMNASMDEGIRVELMTIPPDLAAKWLKRNHINRPLQRRHVVHYVNAIKAGEWDDANGETIIFSDEHDLMDGQHRLTAVVESQRAIVSLVVFGVSTKKRGSIDTGARRQFGDYLGMYGEKNAKQLAAVLGALHAWEDGTIFTYGRG